MEIKGFIKSSLIDWKGKLCSVIFLGRCNFMCRYCYNVDIVRHPYSLETIDIEIILEYIDKHRRWIDGVCITGGEPTVHADLDDLCLRIKDLGFPIKLDTNGFAPSYLEHLIKEELVDYIAVDIKAPLHKYDFITNVSADVDNIISTIYIIEEFSPIPHEYRTTVHWGLLTVEDILEIRSMISKDSPYYLQKVKMNYGIIDESLRKIPNKKFTNEQWSNLLEVMRNKGYPNTYLRK
jgi:pyruvate formate lyase activating enzyme